MKRINFKSVAEKLKTTDYKKLARDFWYGKPHGERRLGDLYCDKTGLYKHREWRGVKDTFYYFHKVWMYNYACWCTMSCAMAASGRLPRAAGAIAGWGRPICRCCTGSTAAWRASGARRCGPAPSTTGL